MARLVEIVTGFGAMVDVPELLQRITADGADLLSAYLVGMVVRDGARMTLVAGTGAYPELVGMSFPLAGSAVEELLATGRRSLSAPGDAYPHLNAAIFRDQPPLPMSVALTRSDGAAAGAIYVVREHPLSPDEIEALELLAAHAGAALQTAQVVAGQRELELAKDLFLATASHELRTPLTVMRGFAETLLNHWDALDDAGRRELVTTILARTANMASLVEQLLLGSRAGLGVELTVRPFDLAAAVRTAAAAIAGSSVAHPVTVDVPPSLLAKGDESTIDAVLGQLVENAVKYSPDGGPVEITLRADGGEAVLTVADRGLGIAEEDLVRVFDRFVRSVPAPGARRSVGGAGLGLYIVRRYVEAQGGRVAAHPREGGGSVLEVRLRLT
jgi:signal transduction histidine kinase